MAFVEPIYSKSQVNRAGDVLTDLGSSDEDFHWAVEVFNNWRAAHAYPVNTFQVTLRKHVRRLDQSALVAQRLKRAISILNKLDRFPTMKLARMQDIGGIRAVLSTLGMARKLEDFYRTGRLQHKLVSSKDYIMHPKPDGYRGAHLVYQYNTSRKEAYNGLHVELQIRTKRQHGWATAVETMGIFLGQQLKAGLGPEEWLTFFRLASAAIALQERSPAVPGFEDHTREDIREQLQSATKELRVFERLSGFAVAANRIRTSQGQGSYHLVTLDLDSRTVTIKPYPVRQLEQANRDYLEIERRERDGHKVEAVLVSAGPIDALKKAYPNYFLDTHQFIRNLRTTISSPRKNDS